MSFETNEKLILSFELKNCEQNYYYRICIKNQENEEENFETEKILCSKGGDDISFERAMHYIFTFEKRQQISIIIKKQKFYSKDENIINFEGYKYFSSLIMENEGVYERNITEEYNSEKIIVRLNKDNSEKEKKYLFDYLKSGMRLSCFISFDFSANVNHDIKEANKNILKYIFQALEIYVSENFFYPSGFGATIKDSQEPFFNMSKSNVNSDVLLEKYKAFIESTFVIPEKKILVSPLIKKITKDVSKLFDSKVYNVSFILLSNNIDEKDKKKVINNIISSSYLPLSIIVIGVGNHDFSVTKKIFKNEKKISYEGIEKNRNNIIFTTLKEHASASQTILFCLSQLYQQIIEYYELIKYNPENDEKEKRKKMFESVFFIQKVIEKNDDYDGEAAPPSSTNPYIKMKSMPIIENKINIDTSNTSSYISQDNFDNNNINSINSNIHSSNNINNINSSNNSTGKFSLKSSTEFVPTPNPFKSIDNGKGNNKKSETKKMENDSGGNQFDSTKSSD